METRVVRVDPFDPRADLLEPCAVALRQGGLVAFPTETVYGLGANALDPLAVSRIFDAKGRPQDNPLIVHVSRPESVAPLVREISPVAERLMETFWPGPLTLIFPKSDLVPPVVTAGLGTVAVRMPDHPVAHLLIDQAGVPVAAPSANISGSPSPTTFEETRADLDGRVHYIIDGGPAGIGVESTVLDISGPIPVVLRPGGLSVEELQAVLGEVRVAGRAAGSEVGTGAGSEAGSHTVGIEEFTGPPPSPGMKYKHYAPKAPVLLAKGDPDEQGRSILLLALKSLMSGKRVAVLASSENTSRYSRLASSYPGSLHVLELGPRSDLAPVAARLFSSLRYADSLGADVILAESFPEAGLGLAIQNRLQRASGGKTVPGLRDATLNLLMVCSGNTCRSPMAEALMRALWDRSGHLPMLQVWSRGTSALPGFPASHEAIEAMAARGLDLSKHLSAPVSEADLETADLVLTMTGAHKNALLGRYPAHAAKVRTLAEVSEGAVRGDVEDPFGLDQAQYDRAAETIERGLSALIARLKDLLGD
ncbi:MAG: L-threonylcarbamoyladenylate synthase [Bacillota bacterium]